MLIVVAELDEMAALDGAAVGRFLAQEDTEQRGLAAAVGTKDAEPLPAAQHEG